MSERPPKGPVSFSKYARNILSRPGTSASAGTLDKASTRTETVSEYSHKEISSDLSFVAEGPISAIAANPDGDRVIIAGRDVLKVLSIKQTEVLEVFGMRSDSRVNLNYASNDVKWGHGPTAGLVATASSNGSIVTWNVETSVSVRKAERVISDHTRAVNRLDFNPGNGSWLLSASQDGSMKLWDLRERDGRARFALQSKAEAVRDVQFNHQNALEIAAVHDNGTLQKWDLRNTKIYERKLSAHHGPALALNWHSDGRHVVTGGRDKSIKVWDLSSEARRPVNTLHTMAPVARVAWRPGDFKTNHQIASSSFSMDTTVNLWSLRRPFISEKVFDKHTDVTTGLLWKDCHTLWTCSKDGTFRQHAVNLAPTPIDTLSHYAFGWSHNGDIAVSLGSRYSDKHRLRVIEDKVVNSSRLPVDTTAGSDRRGSFRNSDEKASNDFDPCLELFAPVQSFAVIESEEDENERFRYFATNFSKSRQNMSSACEENAAVALRAEQYQIAKTWNLLSLALRQLERRQSAANTSAEVANRGSKSSVGSRPTTESLLHQELERSRKVPQSTASGMNATKTDDSLSTSFIMPKYDSIMSPPSTGTSTIPSRPRTADSMTQLSLLSKEESVIEETQTPTEVRLDDQEGKSSTALPTGVEAGQRDLEHSPGSLTWKFNSFGTSMDSNANPWGQSDGQDDSPSNPGSEGSSDGGTFGSPADEGSEQERRMSASAATLQPKEKHVRALGPGDSDLSKPWGWHSIAKRILDHYQGLADVQMNATICLILGEFIDRDEGEVDEWLYCYVELLQRQRLFVTATEVIKSSSSATLRALADSDTMVHTSCARCRKAVPSVREKEGQHWMCNRCQNTVLCVICGRVVKGDCAWCRSCSHVSHARCRRDWLADWRTPEDEGAGSNGPGCVAPDCLCTC